MNKFEKLVRDHEKLKQEYELAFRLKRKLEKENIKLRKHVKFLKTRHKLLENKVDSLVEEIENIALID